jgi:hypothetical protein
LRIVWASMARKYFWNRNAEKKPNAASELLKVFTKKKEPTDTRPVDPDAFLKAFKASNFEGFVEYLASPWRIFWSNLLGGMARGLGIVIGMTVVITILIATLNWIVDFPLIGQYFEDLKNALEAFSTMDRR